MNVEIIFLGAARNVTGSRYLVRADNKQVLIDCGLYQERELRERDWEPFPVPPDQIDAILLTHSHLDHCGFLPKLVREGARCPVYCTPATKEIAEIVLIDSAELQMEDAEFKKKRHKKEKRVGPYPVVPLYTVEDVRNCMPYFSSIEYQSPVHISENIEATFYDAGHILGSSMIILNIKCTDRVCKILFSGDIGREGNPILRDPTKFTDVDYIVMESTYGDRLHESREVASKKLIDTINSTVEAGGNVVIPTFVVERAQDILYYLNELVRTDQIPHLAIFLDSPMATRVTKVFQNHPELFDSEMLKLLFNEQSFFNLSKLFFVETIEASKAINHIKGTIIIMAGSGMCTGGRIKHHLVTNIERRESSIVFVGYQAQGTLGRLIVDGTERVRILGQEYNVRAKIVQIDGFSSHADKEGLMRWLNAFQNRPKHVFITHGEAEAAESFAKNVRTELNWSVSVPDYLERAILI